MQATFKGGYNLSVWKADVSTGEAVEVWHNQPDDRMFTNFANLRLAGDHLIVPVNVGGGGRGGGRGAPNPAPPQGPVDEWERYYSINLATPNAQPVLLTTTDGLIEDQTSVAISAERPDLVLLHERQGHRAATHLVGTSLRRSSLADDDG